jgi:hypothetical protein
MMLELPTFSNLYHLQTTMLTEKQTRFTRYNCKCIYLLSDSVNVQAVGQTSQKSSVRGNVYIRNHVLPVYWNCKSLKYNKTALTYKNNSFVIRLNKDAEFHCCCGQRLHVNQQSLKNKRNIIHPTMKSIQTFTV